jgi:hypothetical protein
MRRSFSLITGAFALRSRAFALGFDREFPKSLGGSEPALDALAIQNWLSEGMGAPGPLKFPSPRLTLDLKGALFGRGGRPSVAIVGT